MKELPKKEDLKKMSRSELLKLAEDLRAELFKVKLEIRGGKIRDYTLPRKIRKTIARCLTYATQKAEAA